MLGGERCRYCCGNLDGGVIGARNATTGRSFCGASRQTNHRHKTTVSCATSAKKGSLDGSNASSESLVAHFIEGGPGDDAQTVPNQTKPDRLLKIRLPEVVDRSLEAEIKRHKLEFFTVDDFEYLIPGFERTARPEPSKNIASSDDIEEAAVDWAREEMLDEITDAAKRHEILPREAHDLVDHLDELIKKGDFIDKYIEYYKNEFNSQSDKPKGLSLIEGLDYDYGLLNHIWFENDQHGMPTARLAHPNGQHLTLHLHGGCITSWVTPNGDENLMVRPDAVFNMKDKINSGICLAFPQYDVGLLPKDGFLGNLNWEVVSSGTNVVWDFDLGPFVTLRCQDTEETRKMWPHNFEMFYKVTLGVEDDPAPKNPKERFRSYLSDRPHLPPENFVGFEDLMNPSTYQTEEEKPKEKRNRWTKKKNSTATKVEKEEPGSQITLQFTLKNTGDTPMEFAFAVKPHFLVEDLSEKGDCVRAVGLGNKDYLDYNVTPGRPRLRSDPGEYLKFGVGGRGLNRIYSECAVGDLIFCAGKHEYFMLKNRAGMKDAIAWQPGDESMEIYHWSKHTSVLGQGRVIAPKILQPGEEWYAETFIRHYDHYFDEPNFGYQDGLPPPKIPEIN